MDPFNRREIDGFQAAEKRAAYPIVTFREQRPLSWIWPGIEPRGGPVALAPVHLTRVRTASGVRLAK